jgi:hypothetical protein
METSASGGWTHQEGKLQTGCGTCQSVLDEPRTNERCMVWQLEWVRETPGWDQASWDRFAVAVRDGDRRSVNRTRLGRAGLLDARGSRRAVAVQDGCREISDRGSRTTSHSQPAV